MSPARFILVASLLVPAAGAPHMAHSRRRCLDTLDRQRRLQSVWPALVPAVGATPTPCIASTA